jgi:hypothetical protein
MPRLILILALIFIAWLLIRWFIHTPPEKISRALKKSALWIIAIVFIALAVTGRMNWILAVGAAILPFAKRALGLIRFLPLIKMLQGRYQASRSYRAPKSGQTSTVETRFLRMTLDHDTGDMDGDVLEGRYEDNLLSQMSLDDVLNLYEECQSVDPESASLLEAYLDHTHQGWREQTTQNTRSGETTTSSGRMTPDEAREILGVGKDATEQEIIHAHRKLMHKLHPDRGGSDYLASKINLAKDCLLGK